MRWYAVAILSVYEESGFDYVVRCASSLLIKASTSAWVGMEGWAPWRVTEMAATAEANLTLATGSLPRRSAVAKAPLKASPAAVVSTAFTLYEGTSVRSPRAERDVAAAFAEFEQHVVAA